MKLSCKPVKTFHHNCGDNSIGDSLPNERPDVLLTGDDANVSKLRQLFVTVMLMTEGVRPAARISSRRIAC